MEDSMHRVGVETGSRVNLVPCGGDRQENNGLGTRHIVIIMGERKFTNSLRIILKY